jgi:hypothetical protein
VTPFNRCAPWVRTQNLRIKSLETSTQMQTIIDNDPWFHLSSSATLRFGPGQKRPVRGERSGMRRTPVRCAFSAGAEQSVFVLMNVLRRGFRIARYALVAYFLTRADRQLAFLQSSVLCVIDQKRGTSVRSHRTLAPRRGAWRYVSAITLCHWEPMRVSSRHVLQGDSADCPLRARSVARSEHFLG